MKSLKILAISIGLTLFPLAHAEDTQQTQATPASSAAAPADNTSMGMILGVRIANDDGKIVRCHKGDMDKTSDADRFKMRRDMADAMNERCKTGAMGRMGDSDHCKMAGMDRMGFMTSSMEEQIHALEKRVDLLQAVVKSLMAE
jgi:hypothetical protein